MSSSNASSKTGHANPARSVPATDNSGGLDSAARRLLAHLASEGACATASEFGQAGTLDVFAKRKGVTLRIAGSSAAAAEILISRDLAAWAEQGSSLRTYLGITSAGQAHLKRAGKEDGGFLDQHREEETSVMDVNGVNADVIVDAAESPLAWLARRKGVDGKTMIDVVQLEAGERLRRDLELAQMLPRVTANWSGGGGNANRGDAHQHISDMMIAARQRVHAALDAVGSDCAGILVDVCGFLKGLGTVEFERSWPRRSAKVVLAIALSALARHYGLSGEAKGPPTSGGLQHWGVSDFRPELCGGLEGQDARLPQT